MSTSTLGQFDYDAVKADEGAELWLVRAPTAVRLLLETDATPKINADQGEEFARSAVVVVF
jgi:hypothetical protein